MRDLLYIPILHTESDLGSLSSAVSRQSIELAGEERWAKHRDVVGQFWQRITDYVLSLEPTSLRIYQDGLAADGEAGLKIIEEAARRGNPNYGLILELVRHRAVFRKTEDVTLLLSEWQNLLQAIGLGEKATADGATTRDPKAYQSKGKLLLKARDQFIARTINETLAEGERGILFLGAYHDVRPYLARDIVVEEVKRISKVRAYFQALLVRPQDWQKLADYLTSPPVPPPHNITP